MNQELQEKLYKKYPNLYKQKDLPMTQTCMNWGICTGDGWYSLIDELSSKLEPLGIEAVQVKEKFGTLRFYINQGNEEVYRLIYNAEEKSGKTCEDCGNPGKTRGKMWVKTLCDKHYEGWVKNE